MHVTPAPGIALALSALLMGCASSRTGQVDETNLGYLDDDAVNYPEGERPLRAKPRVPVAVGRITRKQLDAVLTAGPQPVLASFAVKPRFTAGRFDGWEVQTVHEGSQFAAADLRAGDVVTGVNGQPVERPEQVMTIWSELSRATELWVSFLRAGVAQELRFQILGAPSGRAPTPPQNALPPAGTNGVKSQP